MMCLLQHQQQHQQYSYYADDDDDNNGLEMMCVSAMYVCLSVGTRTRKRWGASKTNPKTNIIHPFVAQLKLNWFIFTVCSRLFLMQYKKTAKNRKINGDYWLLTRFRFFFGKLCTATVRHTDGHMLLLKSEKIRGYKLLKRLNAR